MDELLFTNSRRARVPLAVALILAGLAEHMGVEALLAALEGYRAADPHAPYTSAGVERHLYCAAGELEAVREIFHRYVYGLEGLPEPLEGSPCE